MPTEESTQRMFDKIDQLQKETHEVKVSVARMEGKIDAQVQQDDQHNIDMMQHKEDLKKVEKRVDDVESLCDKSKGALHTLYVAGSVLAALFILAQVLVMIYK